MEASLLMSAGVGSMGLAENTINRVLRVVTVSTISHGALTSGVIKLAPFFVLFCFSSSRAWDEQKYFEGKFRTAQFALDSLRIESEESLRVFQSDSMAAAGDSLKIVRARTFMHIRNEEIAVASRRAWADSAGSASDLRALELRNPEVRERRRREALEKSKKELGLEGLTDAELQAYLEKKHPGLSNKRQK